MKINLKKSITSVVTVSALTFGLSANATKVLEIAKLKEVPTMTKIGKNRDTLFISCVPNSTFFSSSRQFGTKLPKPVFRIKFDSVLATVENFGPGVLLDISPISSFKGFLSAEHFDTRAECQSKVEDLVEESEVEIERLVIKSKTSLSLELVINQFGNVCQKLMRELFTLQIGSGDGIKFLDIDGLTQDRLASNTITVTTKEDPASCMALNFRK